MKRTLAGIIFLVMAPTLSLKAQGDFQNLNFESAQLIPPYPASSATSNALPGWTAFTQRYLFGMTVTQQLTSIQIGFQLSYYPNNFPPVTLIPPIVQGGQGGYGTTPGTVTFDGNFCVLLGGRTFGGPIGGSGFISQTGLVPADAQTMLFKVHNFSGSVQASLDGQSLSLVALLTVPETSLKLGYTLYGADISGFAGQTADLIFSGSGGDGAALLDDIELSSLPVPEPSGVSLIFLGMGVFIWFGRRTRGRSKTWHRELAPVPALASDPLCPGYTLCRDKTGRIRFGSLGCFTFMKSCSFSSSTVLMRENFTHLAREPRRFD